MMQKEPKVERFVEVFDAINGTWPKKEFADLQPNDLFRLYEPDGFMVCSAVCVTRPEVVDFDDETTLIVQTKEWEPNLELDTDEVNQSEESDPSS